MNTQPQQQPPQPTPPPERHKRTPHQSTEVRLAIVETRWQDVVPTLATKADLNEAVGLSKMELKSEIAELRTEMHKMDATITRWMLGAIIGLFIGLGTLYFAQQRSMDMAISRLERLYVPVQVATPPPAPLVQPQQPD